MLKYKCTTTPSSVLSPRRQGSPLPHGPHSLSSPSTPPPLAPPLLSAAARRAGVTSPLAPPSPPLAPPRAEPALPADIKPAACRSESSSASQPIPESSDKEVLLDSQADSDWLVLMQGYNFLHNILHNFA